MIFYHLQNIVILHASYNKHILFTQFLQKYKAYHKDSFIMELYIKIQLFLVWLDKEINAFEFLLYFEVEIGPILLFVTYLAINIGFLHINYTWHHKTCIGLRGWYGSVSHPLRTVFFSFRYLCRFTDKKLNICYIQHV